MAHAADARRRIIPHPLIPFRSGADYASQMSSSTGVLAMRTSSSLLATLVLSTIWVGASLAEMPADMPKRKPGLWEMKTTMAEMGGMGQTVDMCVGPQTDDLIAQQDKGECTKKSYHRDGDRFLFKAVCKIKGSTATIEGVFSGDFENRYSGEIRSNYVPPLEGMKSMTIKQDARWLGACKSGQKPGDVMMRGVNGINIEEMMKNMPRPPGR